MESGWRPKLGTGGHRAPARSRRGGRTRWAHFEFTRRNVALTMVKKGIEELMNGGRSVQSDRCKNSMVQACQWMRRSPNSSGSLAVNRVWRARRWEAIQQGQELSFAKTEWCLPATSRKLSAVWERQESRDRFETITAQTPGKTVTLQ